jgi:hypothetical protein
LPRGKTAGQLLTLKNFLRGASMRNAILQICEKLRGYSDKEPYFEVTEIKQNENGTYTVIVQVVEPTAAEQGAQNESNE